MKSRSSGYSSDSEKNNQQDLSILRKPISTALNGFFEAKRAYENGTEEIRRLLSRECDIIYECNICRNMFRSLTNFISHKRVYCRNTFNILTHNLNSNKNGYIDHDVSTIIEAEEEYVNQKSTNNNANNNIKTENGSSSNKDLSSIIERLLHKEQANRVLKLSDFYEQVNNKLTEDEILKKKHTLMLDKVPNSNAAVYQTIKIDENDNDNDNDNIKNEVNEVNEMLANGQNVLGPDGKIITEIKQDNDLMIIPNNKNSTERLKCDICNKGFVTEKMLKLHIQAKHINSTYVYQCPSCLQAFLQPGAVFRHLANDHNKSTRRIRLMRDSILRRRVKISEMQTKGASKELARLQIKTDDETQNMIKNGGNSLRFDDYERSNTNISSTLPQSSSSTSSSSLSSTSLCPYCGKKFERKAVLTTHLTNCQMKMKNPSTNVITTRRSANDIRNSNRIDNNLKLISGTNSNESSELNSIKSEKKRLLGHSILASIDLTRDDCPTPPVVVSKRKRKKTLKILKDKCNDLESDKLNEMFLKLGCCENTTVSINTVPIDVESRENSNDSLVEKQSIIKLNGYDDGKDATDDQKIIVTDDKSIVQKSEEMIQLEMLDVTVKPITILQECVGKLDNSKEKEKDQFEKNLSIILPLKTTKTMSNQGEKMKPVVENQLSPLTQFMNSEETKQTKSYICKICEKRFDVLSNVRRHISMFHYRSRKFGCRICKNYRAFRKFDVINHMNASHSISTDRETAMPFVEVFDDKSKSEGVEGDIKIVENDGSVPPSSKEVNGPVRVKKRARRQKIPKDVVKAQPNITTTVVNTTAVSANEHQPPIKLKFTRSSSNLSLSSNDDSLSIANSVSKRPIRNRIKPVHKDFVYDLSTILKKDSLSEILPAKAQKRRNTVSSNIDMNGRDDLLLNKISNGEASEQQQLQQHQQQQHQQQHHQKPIKGSAQKMAKLAVASFRASFCQMSDNFPEKSNFPVRVFPPIFIDHTVSDDFSKNSKSLQTKISDITNEQKKFRRMSDDGVVHTLSKRKRLDSTLTRSAGRHNAKLSNELKTKKNEAKKLAQFNDNEKITVKCPTQKEFNDYLITNKLSEPVKKISVATFVDPKISETSSTPPPAPAKKRITLMQRLAENQNKRLQQSLLRSVLEN